MDVEARIKIRPKNTSCLVNTLFDCLQNSVIFSLFAYKIFCLA